MGNYYATRLDVKRSIMAQRLSHCQKAAGTASLRDSLETKSKGDTMTEPTDAELWQFYMTLPGATPTSQPDPIEIMRATLAKWGTPAVAKWAPEEIADGERGIRWVTNEGIHGRPTDHDVREYLKRTPTAHGCHCNECKQFYTAPQPTQSQTQGG